jgi:endonuclease/exonuclease/phosphatase family metal-dependent hydrolase
LLSLKDRRGGTFVHAVCTHYDDQGVRARGESSLLIRRAIREWVDGVEANAGLASMKLAPVILFGDFSAPC